jgi:hypothetical protein
MVMRKTFGREIVSATGGASDTTSRYATKEETKDNSDHQS